MDPAKNPDNLRIHSEAAVGRIIFECGDAGVRAKAVECDLSGERKLLRAQRKIILAAGAYHSPQLLQLSDIGDAQLLGEHGISVVLDRPVEGANLQDHYIVPMGFRVNPVSSATTASLQAGVCYAIFAIICYRVADRSPYPRCKMALSCAATLDNRAPTCNIIAAGDRGSRYLREGSQGCRE